MKHFVTIGLGAYGFRADCLCGWQSDVDWDRATVAAAGEAHREEEKDPMRRLKSAKKFIVEQMYEEPHELHGDYRRGWNAGLRLALLKIEGASEQLISRYRKEARK